MGGRGAIYGSGNSNGGYVSFPDKAKSTHTYTGSGKAQEDFFRQNSNYDELIDNMTSEEMDAFQWYTMGTLMRGQQYNGWDGMNEFDRSVTQHMDEVLDRTVLNEGVTLTRRSTAEFIRGEGNTRPYEPDFQNAEGTIIHCPAALSSGAASQGLTIGSPNKDVEYKIHIPKGARGAGMWVGDERINGWGREQREFVINRDSIFKVGKYRYNARRNVYTVDVYWMGRSNHDYGTTGPLW